MSSNSDKKADRKYKGYFQDLVYFVGLSVTKYRHSYPSKNVVPNDIVLGSYSLEGRRTFVWTFESDNVFSRDNALQFDSNKSTDCKNFLKAAEEETFYEECQRSVGKQMKWGNSFKKVLKNVLKS